MERHSKTSKLAIQQEIMSTARERLRLFSRGSYEWLPRVDDSTLFSMASFAVPGNPDHLENFYPDRVFAPGNGDQAISRFNELNASLKARTAKLIELSRSYSADATLEEGEVRVPMSTVMRAVLMHEQHLEELEEMRTLSPGLPSLLMYTAGKLITDKRARVFEGVLAGILGDVDDIGMLRLPSFE